MGTDRPASPKEYAQIWQRAFAKVDGALREAEADAVVHPSAMIDRWIVAHSNPAFPLRPIRRPPATVQAISVAESRLGFKLPAQVRELYAATDGLEWVPSKGAPMAFGGHFPPLAKLVLAADLEIPLSTLIERQWQGYEDPEEPQQISVYGPDALAHVTDEPEVVLSFGVADKFLALQHPPDAQCILIAHRDGLPVALGAVLEVEGLLATRYDSLSHWLSAQVGLLGVLPRVDA